MNRLIVIPFLIALSACGGRARIPEPVIVVQRVEVPVSLPCVPAGYSLIRPDYIDNDAALKGAADPAERYQLLWGGREQRIARERENEAAISGCPQASSK